MGDYRRYLIPGGNVLSPGGDALVKLVERLRKDKWIPSDRAAGSAVRTIENEHGGDAAKRRAAQTEPIPEPLTKEWLDAPAREELRLVWNVGPSDSETKYPLTHRPEGAAPFTIELHRCTEFVYPVAKTIGPLPTTCRCGEDLSFEWDEDELVPAFVSSTGIFTECEECSRTFDPSKGTATIENPFGGPSEELRGGAAHRFALVVDCGSSFVKDPSLALSPELTALFGELFGRTFYEVGAVF